MPDSAVSGGFAEFADKTGARSLLELLEASAAYLAIIQDVTHFSRDNIVSYIGEVVDSRSLSDESTRQSLNRLLREGKILRVTKDTFTISKSTRNGFNNKLAG